MKEDNTRFLEQPNQCLHSDSHSINMDMHWVYDCTEIWQYNRAIKLSRKSLNLTLFECQILNKIVTLFPIPHSGKTINNKFISEKGIGRERATFSQKGQEVLFKAAPDFLAVTTERSFHRLLWLPCKD